MDELEYSPTLEDTIRLSLFPEMLGGLSHELAQPLNAITLACEVMRLKMGRTDLPASEKEFFDVRLKGVKSQVTRAVSLLDQFRSFFMETDVQKEPADLHKSLERVLELIGQQLTARGIIFSTKKTEIPISCNWPNGLVELAIAHCLIFIRNTIDSMRKMAELSDRSIGCNLIIQTRSLGSGAQIDFTFDPEFDDAQWAVFSDSEIPFGLAATKNIIVNMGGNLILNKGMAQLSFPQLRET